MTDRIHKLTLRAILVALTFVLSWLEAQIPTFIAVPGVKLGLTNLVVLLALYKLGWKDALVINFVRIVLAGLTFGSLASMWYALAGGLLSGIGMILVKNLVKARIVVVSIVGGLLHNLGQLLVAVFILDSPSLFYYLVILWLVGSFSGALIGVIGALIVDRVGVLPNDKNSRA